MYYLVFVLDLMSEKYLDFVWDIVMVVVSDYMLVICWGSVMVVQLGWSLIKVLFLFLFLFLFCFVLLCFLCLKVAFLK